MGLSDIFSSLKTQSRNTRSLGGKGQVVKSTQPTKVTRKNSQPRQSPVTKKGKLVKGKGQRAGKGSRKGKGNSLIDEVLCLTFNSFREKEL